mmetsp:Transcript_80376/g.126938  ORF Transcript_80376/g.126938 Transcript_80376/m.126938 type:complete len:255 (-) Transcript_80376:83-847(-)
MVAACLKVIFCTYLIVSVVRAFMLWNEFTCSQPIQAWLVVQQLIVLLLCLGHQLACYIPGPSFGGLLPVQGNRRQKVVSYTVLLIIVPAFIASDAVGLVWFLTIPATNDSCWPSDVVNDPQVMALVLFGYCCWGLIYMLFALSLVCNINGLRLGFFGRTERQRRNRPLLQTGSAQQRTLVAPLQTLLMYCPEAVCDKDCEVDCSICQETCTENQKMRTVVVCGHQYHSECLETWLRNRPVCPNCQQDVTTPVEV